MSTFDVSIKKITISPHPDADRLEVGRIEGYDVVVGKGLYTTGDDVVYLPEGSVLPEWLLERMNLSGMLAGSKHNRVKIVRLRGIYSQGVVVPMSVLRERMDIVGDSNSIAGALGVTKYEPEIPQCMRGEVCNLHGYTINYDIENIKNHPGLVHEGDDIELTEKLHGTWACVGAHEDLDHPELDMGRVIITSKGQSAKGLAMKYNDQNREGNAYVRMYDALGGRDFIERSMAALEEMYGKPTDTFYILGELFGKGVQDLHYNASPSFRVFDVYLGKPGEGRYMHVQERLYFCDKVHVLSVPSLYRGPYSAAVLEEYTNGKETVSGAGVHMREGVVLRMEYEVPPIPNLGRLILKSVSTTYLMRKGGTEFN